MYPFFVVLAALIFWHALADYPLQGDFLAKAKNRKTPVPGIDWRVALFMHSVIHAGGVWLITGHLILGLVELFLHYLIDDAKCRNYITFKEDQSYHLVCKIAFAIAAVMAPNWGYGILPLVVIS
jgi:hypothetical protein